MQNTKPAQTIKYATFVIKYTTVITVTTHRPPADDPRRSHYDAVARLTWRIIIILTAFLASQLVKDWSLDNNMIAVFAADRLPDIIREVGEYIKHL